MDTMKEHFQPFPGVQTLPALEAVGLMLVYRLSLRRGLLDPGANCIDLNLLQQDESINKSLFSSSSYYSTLLMHYTRSDK